MAKEIENTDVKPETNPQILEMTQTIQEQSKKLAEATKLITDLNAAAQVKTDNADQIAADKLAQEKDIKAKLGVNKTAEPKRSIDDINSMTNAELLETMAIAVEGAVEATREEAGIEIDKNFKGLESKFDNLVGHVMKKDANAALQQVRTDNPDFDKHTKEISAALDKYPQFNYQDAFDWVVMQKAKDQIATKHIASEKPNEDLSAATDDIVRHKKEPTTRKLSSKRAFSNRILEAVEAVQARRGGQR